MVFNHIYYTALRLPTDSRICVLLQLVLGNLMGNDGNLCASEWVISFSLSLLSRFSFIYAFDLVLGDQVLRPSARR